MLAHLRPEHRLVCILCRPILSDRLRLMAEGILASEVDWAFFCQFIESRGIIPLVSRHIERTFPDAVPFETRCRLLALAGRYRAEAEAMAGQLARVLQRLESEGIRAVPFKGPVMVEEAWGSAGMRTSSDLDILVRPGEFRRAIAAVERCGFVRTIADALLAEPYGLTSCELTLSQGVSCAILVDLQTAFLPDWVEAGVESGQVWASLRRRPFRGAEIWVLPGDWNLLFLALHAYKHSLSALRWLADLRALAQADPGAWTRARRRAEALGVGRQVALVDEVARALLDEEWIDPGALNPFVRKMAEMPLGAAITPLDVLGFESALRGRKRRLAYWLRVLFKTSPTDVRTIALPRGLFFAYRAIRPVRLALTYLAAPLAARWRGRGKGRAESSRRRQT